jgi:hypothetical protein
MTELTHALHRDDLGFLTPRSPKLPGRSPEPWMAIVMVVCWIGSCALSLVVSFGWIG